MRIKRKRAFFIRRLSVCAAYTRAVPLQFPIPSKVNSPWKVITICPPAGQADVSICAVPRTFWQVISGMTGISLPPQAYATTVSTSQYPLALTHPGEPHMPVTGDALTM